MHSGILHHCLHGQVFQGRSDVEVGLVVGGGGGRRQHALQLHRLLLLMPECLHFLIIIFLTSFLALYVDFVLSDIVTVAILPRRSLHHAALLPKTNRIAHIHLDATLLKLLIVGIGLLSLWVVPVAFLDGTPNFVSDYRGGAVGLAGRLLDLLRQATLSMYLVQFQIDILRLFLLILVVLIGGGILV